MPQLPSGRMIVLDPTPLNTLLAAIHSQENRQAVLSIKSIADLYPYIGIATLVPASPDSDGSPPGPALMAGSLPLPPGMASRSTGFSVCALDALAADWSAEDRQSMSEFLDGRAQALFEAGLESVRKAQAELGELGDVVQGVREALASSEFTFDAWETVTDEPRRMERRYDFQLNSQVSLPQIVVTRILELIRRDDVRSVSCAYDDPVVWKALVDEQVQRAKESGLPPQDAFTLCGPDGGLWDTPVEAWGGVVHIPYEGLCGGDLLVRPTWRRFRIPEGTQTGRLSTAASVKCCYYVLSPEDFGEVPFATREEAGEWVLYRSKAPYEPCKPLANDLLDLVPIVES